MRRRFLLLILPLMMAAPLCAGEKSLMHCFAWTEVKEATPADWEAFYKASDAMPEKIKGVKRVWYGPLAQPLGQTMLAKIDPEAFKKLQAGESVGADVKRMQRQFGMCIEMDGPDARASYGKDPYHAVWEAAYAKVRVDGTTTFDILGK